MKKQSAKETAQDELMHAMQGALDNLRDKEEGDPSENALIAAHAEKQFRRIEKMFGYQHGSWSAGA